MDLAELALATGALGLAAYGFVDGLKFLRFISLAGFASIRKTLGPIYPALARSYGDEFEEVLQSHYRCARLTGDLPRTLRQGARLALVPVNAAALAEYFGTVDPKSIVVVAEKLESGKTLSEEDRAALGRYELAVDARIDAALQLADSRYTNTTRIIAALFALSVAILVGFGLANSDWMTFFYGEKFIYAIIVGLAAIPLAPVSKDLANALRAAEQALRKR
ncbi:MAG: hypothetical protein ACREQZ_09430 [Woeseiaceae bacterium]